MINHFFGEIVENEICYVCKWFDRLLEFWTLSEGN